MTLKHNSSLLLVHVTVQMKSHGGELANYLPVPPLGMKKHRKPSIKLNYTGGKRGSFEQGTIDEFRVVFDNALMRMRPPKIMGY